jgi:arylsulfatase
MRELATPRVINLIKDPQEREPVSLPYMHSWTIGHFNRILTEFRADPLRRADRPRPSASAK